MKLEFCALCGSKELLEHHHVIPLALGGTDKEDNLLTLCSKHHCQIHNLNDKRVYSSELIKAVKEKQKKMGKFVGGRTPFGHKVVDGVLVKDEKQYPILKKMILLKTKGYSYGQLKNWLKETHNISLTRMGIADVLRRNNELEKNYRQNLKFDVEYKLVL